VKQPRTVSFVVLGRPVPQPRPRISMASGFARAYTPANHPVVAYRKAIHAIAKKRIAKCGASSVVVEVSFVFQRPKSHWNKRGLKEDAPRLPRPDVDNLLKSVLDALTTAGVVDDDTFVKDARCRKRYVSDRIQEHTVVRLTQM
jgi:Holliday junction resolvase RusA-like endonuclease